MRTSGLFQSIGIAHKYGKSSDLSTIFKDQLDELVKDGRTVYVIGDKDAMQVVKELELPKSAIFDVRTNLYALLSRIVQTEHCRDFKPYRRDFAKCNSFEIDIIAGNVHRQLRLWNTTRQKNRNSEIYGERKQCLESCLENHNLGELSSEQLEYLATLLSQTIHPTALVTRPFQRQFTLRFKGALKNLFRNARKRQKKTK